MQQFVSWVYAKIIIEKGGVETEEVHVKPGDLISARDEIIMELVKVTPRLGVRVRLE
jgi:hypothetical protein